MPARQGASAGRPFGKSTIIGIPFGIANFKLIPVALMPLGKQIVDLP